MGILGYLLIIGAVVGAAFLLVACFRQKPEQPPKTPVFPSGSAYPERGGAYPPPDAPVPPVYPPVPPAPVAAPPVYTPVPSAPVAAPPTYAPAPIAAPPVYAPVPSVPAPVARTPEPPVSAPAPAAEPPKPEPASPAVKEQHTIYAFEREAQVCVCPRCDGENNIYRSNCCICGFELRRGGWGR